MVKMTTNGELPTQERANGINLHFGFPTDNRVGISYKRFWLHKSGWTEGHQIRTLALTFNDQCLVAETIGEIKQIADAIGICFGNDPVLTVTLSEQAQKCHLNWRQLSEGAAQYLGWRLVCPIDTNEIATNFVIDV